jgi:hypothetical protein
VGADLSETVRGESLLKLDGAVGSDPAPRPVSARRLVGLAECAEYLGIVSRGGRPGNRLWELLRAGKLQGLPYVRIGRSYRFDLADVEAWVRHRAARSQHGTGRFG